MNVVLMRRRGEYYGKEGPGAVEPLSPIQYEDTTQMRWSAMIYTFWGVPNPNKVAKIEKTNPTVSLE